MIPGPKKDNTLIIIVGLVILAVIAIGIVIYTAPAPEEEESVWVIEEGEALTPNATAIIILPEACQDCDSTTLLLDKLGQDSDKLGTVITSVGTFYDSSEEGRNLIIKYNITKLPTMILQKEGQWDNRMLSFWFAEIGTIEDDGSLVYREVTPPYYDITNDSVRGKVGFIFIKDKECRECYNVVEFAMDLASIFRMYVKDIAEYDSSSVEGNAIVSEYEITAVPTFLISDEAEVYSGFEEFWFSHDNTRADDGWYVFRDVKYLGVEYRQLGEED